MRHFMNRLAAVSAAVLCCVGTGVAVFAAGGRPSAVLRVCIPVLSALALLGLGLMLVISYERFRRHEG